jgi:hypothetical protein
MYVHHQSINESNNQSYDSIAPNRREIATVIASQLGLSMIE